MSNNDDFDWFKQTLRATFPYLVFCLVFIVGALVIVWWASAAPDVTVLDRAHSHNDYLRTRPLEDALSLGFSSAEADIHLVDGDLLVAHDREDVVKDRTLQNLYLEPLWKRFQAHGSIYGQEKPFTLLIDIKSEGKTTFEALHDVLLKFEAMLTRFDTTPVQSGAVTVVISGNRDFETILGAQPRLSGVDGRLADLDGEHTAAEMPLISDNWMRHFKWWGSGSMPESERERLHNIVERAHAQGKRVRFWATPEREALWKELVDAEVDLLNADDLPRLQRFLAGTPDSP